MGFQYRCGSQGRRQTVKAGKVVDLPTGPAPLNGIDFLEVVDREAPAPHWRQRLLLIRCFWPVPTTLSAENTRIDGGVRITGVRVLGAGPLLELATAPSGVFAPLAGWLTDCKSQLDSHPTDDPAKWLVALTDGKGDYSTYQFSLIADATTTAPPSGFDRLLSAVDFSFKVECPSDFDCAEPRLTTTALEPSPVLDYLTKDYASFRSLMLDRMRTTLGDWREESPADLGVTLVELLAYAADHLSYFQDAVATEAYLGTARKRTSVRRHARLLDYRLHEGCNARVWVHLQMADGQVLDGGSDPILAKGTAVLTEVAAIPVLTTTELAELVVDKPLTFETLHHVYRLTHAQNKIEFHTWGDDDCCLPRGSTRAAFADDPDPAKTLGLKRGDVLILEEIRSPDTGAKADADPSHRHAVRLVEDPVASFDPVEDVHVVEVRWADEDALPFDLCLKRVVTETEDEHGTKIAVVPVTVARGNIVLADFGWTVSADTLVPSKVDRPMHYRPHLSREGLTHAVTFDQQVAIGAENGQGGAGRVWSALETLHQDPRYAVPRIELRDTSENVWRPRRDLLASSPTAREFVVEVDEASRAHLRFGDNTFGRHPVEDDVLLADFRLGNGSEGNVGAETLAHIVSNTLKEAVAGVRNPIAAWGGTDREPLERARLHAPAAFKVQERAVSEEDWAEVAERHPEVQRAVATIRWTGSWYTVFLAVDRLGGQHVDEMFVRTLTADLDRYRLAGYELELDPPEFVPLDIALTVCVEPDAFTADVKRALLLRFSRGMLTDGRRGYFHPDNFTFGQPVYLSELVAAAMEVPGVAWVDTRPTRSKMAHRFRRLHEAPLDELREGVIPMGRLEIARLDNDPNAPENGRLEFFMRGGQ